MNIQALNGLNANVSFRIGSNEYNYIIQNVNDVDGYSNGTYGSALAQAISSRNIYLTKSKNGLEDLDGNNRDDLDTAIESALRFSMHKIIIDQNNGIVMEEDNPDILTQLDIEQIEQNNER